MSGHRVGDRVIAGTRFGGYAELVAVDAGQVVPLPERLGFEQGAAFPVNYATAYAALVVMGGLKPGERVLIHAAAGGVGIAATQIARGIGAEILGTASAAKHEAIRAQGVDHAIDYRTGDFAVEVMRVTGGDRARPDHRCARAGELPQGLRDPAARAAGWSCSGSPRCRPASGADLRALLRGLARMPLATMPWWKSLQMMSENKGVFGLNMLKWWDDEGLDRVLDPLRAGLESGDLTPVVAASFPFERAADAHRYIGERRNVGKVVLTPGPAAG